jgi:hypothetical protein
MIDGQSAGSAIGFGRRLQRREIAGLRNMGSCSITKRGKEKDEEKMPVGKELTGGVQDIAPPRCSFLRRKVTSESKFGYN